MANIFSLNVDNFTKKQVLGKISEFLADGRQHWIATVNPEIALKARKDKEYCDILNKADLRVADGMGIILASLFFGERLRERMYGQPQIRQEQPREEAGAFQPSIASKNRPLPRF